MCSARRWCVQHTSGDVQHSSSVFSTAWVCPTDCSKRGRSKPSWPRSRSEPNSLAEGIWDEGLSGHEALGQVRRHGSDEGPVFDVRVFKVRLVANLDSYS